jgi:hypothetical protein
MLVMLSAALPVLVSVTICAALVELTCWLANVKLNDDRLTVGAGTVVPVPLSVIVCGLPVALSVMVLPRTVLPSPSA